MTVPHRVTLKRVLLAATMLASPLLALTPMNAAAQQMEDGLSVQVAPPILPIYAQPPLPTDGYVWIPGFWHWSQVAGYY